MARVLVVDDEPDIRGFLAPVLECEGFEVDTAVDGVEALDKISACRPELVLLDLMMPRLDGYGVLERLRDQPRLAVVVLSAKADRDRAQRAGAVDAVGKPFNLAGLFETCRRALSG